MAWFSKVATASEMAQFEARGYFDAGARYVPTLLRQLQGLTGSDAPSPTDPSQLATIPVPVLIGHGSPATRQWFTDSVRHLADHVPTAEVREIPGVGHHAPWLQPEPVAREIVRFLAPQGAAPSLRTS